MDSKLDKVIKQTYGEYKKQLSVFEKERKGVEKKIKKLNHQYKDVLDLLKIRTKKTRKGGVRAKRGETKKLILAQLAKSKGPIRANELIKGLTSGKNKVSGPSVRQLLPKLVAAKEIVKNSNKTYSLPG